LTDPKTPVEIGYQDRGPVPPERMQMGGKLVCVLGNKRTLIVSSEICSWVLDILNLKPSALFNLKNEIAAAKLFMGILEMLQGHPMFVWHPST